jgi:protein tyrosine phosphatase (PTP) superfamily phosphohydrolase (DUF442 family)
MRTVITAAACLLLAAGCGNRPSSPAAALPTDSSAENWQPQKLPARHVPNAWQVHPQVISGGQPDGEAAFRELAALGVKTIVSVDGARPDVAAAEKYGLRYVHLPHGYDGVPAERAQQLAKAVRDLPGPVYIHCHHGKHRSPAAAAVACVGAGLLPASAGEAILRSAGTSERYQGLYDSARAARVFESKLLDELAADFPQVAQLPPMAEAMVALERTYDHLLEIEAAGWRSPPKHPDLDPPHEALLLREHFTELLRSETSQNEPEAFQQLLRDSEAAAIELEATLRQQNQPSGDEALAGSLTATAAAALARVTANCQACHAEFRDVPLPQK